MEKWTDTVAKDHLLKDTEVKKYGLEDEVVNSFFFARTKLELNVEQAINYALTEWDVY